jgi:hypothetical protein
MAAVAVVWERTTGFGGADAAPPTGYTDISDTIASYSDTDISFWFDAAASSSPTGTFNGEGCCVIALI